MALPWLRSSKFLGMDEGVKQIGRQREADGQPDQWFDHDKLR
jgi:hypothetical protein